ncbi:MAG: class I SAM-dependent methyltransferase [Oscillospiraceae bacterium]|nr:class I SAM-dependent methyltransferase [Oscillospiraceae bacterium]
MAYSAFAEFYDGLTQNVSYPKRAAYFHELLKKFGCESGILLDLACGTGSLSVEMAKLGYDVIGVDGSCEMLSEAMSKKAESGQDVLYLCQQMEELDLYGTINATVCALDSLNHVTDIKTLEKIFERVSLFSEPGAVFVFDVNTVYKHREVLGNNVFVYDTDSVYCVWQNSYSEENHIVEITLDFFVEEDGAYYRESEFFCERAYTCEEIDELLEKTGFEKLAVYGEDCFDKPAEDAQRLIYAARKR